MRRLFPQIIPPACNFRHFAKIHKKFLFLFSLLSFTLNYLVIQYSTFATLKLRIHYTFMKSLFRIFYADNFHKITSYLPPVLQVLISNSEAQKVCNVLWIPH